MNYFAISDIHGHANELNRLLECWNPDNQELVLLGDYIDRGHYSLDVLKTVKRLGDEYGAILLKGNHEDMLLGFLEEKGDLDSYYFEHAAVETILSLLEDERLNRFNISQVYNADEIRDIIMTKQAVYIKLIENMRLFYETDCYIFVHAGFNPHLNNFKNSTEKDFMYIRNQFHYAKNETEKIAVFGHTNTRLLHNSKNDNIWIDKWNSKIGIDGGAGSNHQLNGVFLNGNGNLSDLKVYQVDCKKN